MNIGGGYQPQSPLIAQYLARLAARSPLQGMEPGSPMMPMQTNGDAAQRGYRGLFGSVTHAQPHDPSRPYVSPIIAAAAGQAEQRQPSDLPNGWFGDTSGIPAAALAAIIQRLAHQSQRGGRPV